MENKTLNNFYARLKKEGIIKSVLFALAVSFAVLLITAGACWFADFGGYWLCIVLFVLSFGATMPLIYHFKFRPTKKYVAKRVDKLGLDERMLTMVEFEDQDSYIYRRQREDAEKTLQKYNSSLIKFVLSTSLIVCACVIAFFGVSMTTVYGLSQADVLPSGKELVRTITAKPAAEYTLVYRLSDKQKEFATLYSASCPEGATEITITVKEGDDGEVILPVANKGYVFVGWSDGYNGVYRTDKDVQGRVIVTAIFEELSYNLDDDTPGGGSSSDDTGADSQPPADPSDNNNNNNNDPSKDPSDDPVSPSGDQYKNDQFVFDGKTKYTGAPYKDALDTAVDEISKSTGVDEDAKNGVLDYFDVIGKD